jgi:hypothetical protein
MQVAQDTSIRGGAQSLFPTFSKLAGGRINGGRGRFHGHARQSNSGGGHLDISDGGGIFGGAGSGGGSG